MDSPPLPSQRKIIQNIKYAGSETEFSAEVVGQEVTVQCSSGQHSHGSSKVKLINRIDYNWEFHYYRGQLVAVHINGKIVAYGMKGKDGGMVRVTNQETGERALIKNLKNDVRDVSFAFSRQQIILGCIDDEGNVMIYEIIDQPSSISYTLLLHIFHRDVVPHSTPNFRIIWCPYLACFDDDDDLESTDDPEKMFVVLNNGKAEVWNFGIINSKYGTGPLEPNQSFDGYVEISHTAELVDASFSSDGTAIAIACSDGYVKFFQIYMVDNEKQKCLHEWRPHENKALSSIIFVDNLLECSSQCWKFTITGANHNSELKLWSCETWTCLQTIHFQPDLTNVIQSVYLKIAIDYSGKYLVLSDLNNKVLYILELKRNDNAQQISVTTLSQFLLPTAFLSFHITEANYRKLGSSEIITDDYATDLDDQDDDDEDEVGVTAVVVKLLVIQQKKFQECNIVFQPNTILFNTEITYDDIPDEEIVEKVPKLDDLQSSVTLLIKQQQQQQQQQQQALMTPEAFISTEQKISRPGSVRNSLGAVEVKAEASSSETVENLIDFQRPEKDNFASGGSSPSREVQEILALNNSSYNTQDYFDNLSKLPEEQEIPQKEYNSTGDLIYSENENWLKLPPINVKEKEIAKEELRLGGGDDIANLNDSEWGKTQLQAVNLRLNDLQGAINEQNLVIQKIHQELKSLAENKNSNVKEDLSRELDVVMSKQQLHIAKMLENVVTMQKTKEREQQERVMASISQIVGKTVNDTIGAKIEDKMQSVVAHQMKQVVVPANRSLVEALKHHIDLQNTQKATSDMILQDRLSKLVNGKALAESLSSSVSHIITPILEKLYREMIANTLVPSWERICGTMFHQINETFAQGTKEYTASVENYMEKQRRVQDKGKELIGQMQVTSETLQSTSEKLPSTVAAEIHKQLASTMKHMQDTLAHNIKEIVSEQVKLGFKNHASVLEDSVINAVRSRAVTPSPHVDTQVTLGHIDHLLSKESYDEAFQLVLSAENLNFVIYVCEKVDTNTVFNVQNPLPQNCILALIQQLSTDLHKNTDIKLSYIRAALVALIPGFPHTKQFIPKVLKDLLKQLQLFMSTGASGRYLTDAKLLKMVAESILDK